MTPTQRIWATAALGFAVLVLVWAQSYAGRVDQNRSQVAGCERGKLDRAANAKAFRAQAEYLNLVLAAQSVKDDVKRAARMNQREQDRSARSLESRTGGRLDCQVAFPKPSPLP